MPQTKRASKSWRPTFVTIRPETWTPRRFFPNWRLLQRIAGLARAGGVAADKRVELVVVAELRFQDE